MSRRVSSLVYCLAVVALGLVWRLAPLHLPFFLYKYGGSALWAIAVYWLIEAAFPRASTVRCALLAGAVALVVELSRLYHSPGLDAFRTTLAGKLLLGRFFSLKNIVAYWLAIAFVAALDQALLRRDKERRS